MLKPCSSRGRFGSNSQSICGSPVKRGSRLPLPPSLVAAFLLGAAASWAPHTASRAVGQRREVGVKGVTDTAGCPGLHGLVLSVPLCTPLQSPGFGVIAVCATAVSRVWCYRCVRHCCLQGLVLSLCASLLSPGSGAIAVCATAVSRCVRHCSRQHPAISRVWCYRCVRHCSH